MRYADSNCATGITVTIPKCCLGKSESSMLDISSCVLAIGAAFS